jgi:tetrachlorobenzoquinone reductase
MISRTFEAQVIDVRREADDIKSFELAFALPHDRSNLCAGAHIDVHLPEGTVRSYSLVGWTDCSYRVAVARDRLSRGGSKWMHDKLGVGDKLVISEPRNHFPLNEQAIDTLLIAGGIGITPIYAMAQRLDELGKPWRLHYFTRSASAAAFVRELQAMHGTVVLQTDDVHGGPPDLSPLIQSVSLQTDIYCCGPVAMLQRFEQLTQDIAPARVHVEYFGAARPPDTQGGVTVTLARRKKVILVPPGKTILDAILDDGIDAPCSCMEGHCGTCESMVLDGVPDHRDVFLTAEQKAKNDRIMICVSGSLTSSMTLDL